MTASVTDRKLSGSCSKLEEEKKKKGQEEEKDEVGDL